MVMAMSHFFCIFGRMSKGRDTGLLEARDTRLFERWYYWTEVQRLRFDDALKKISHEEFFISEARAMQIIRKAIAEGRTVDGKSIRRPMFSGFRIKDGNQREKPLTQQRKSSPSGEQMTIPFS